jgi:hypothetical protein
MPAMAHLLGRLSHHVPPRVPALLSKGLAGLMLVQALAGLLLADQYRDPEPIKTTWFGNDWVTLVLATPLLLAGIVSATRGSTRGLVLWLGVIAYAVYNYAFYLFGAALNAFLPLYVLTMVIAVVVLILALSALDVETLARSSRPNIPLRAIGGSLMLIGIGLAVVWIALWWAYIFINRPTPIDPEAFKIVAALDLSLMVPALTCGGVLLWRRSPWGYIIASIASIQAALYLFVLSVNSLVAIQRGVASAPGELPMWGPLAIVMTIVALALVTNLRPSAPRCRPES